MHIRKLIVLLAVLATVSGCAATGLSKKQQAQIEKTISEYNEKLVGKTWWNYRWGYAYRFYEDGRVEESGSISEPGNWYISFGEQYNRNSDLSKYRKKFIEQYCDYYLRFDSPSYYDHPKQDYRISFNEKGNLVLFDDEYEPGVDYIHEIPEDAYLDDYFLGTYKANNWGVWGFEYEDGKIGSIWVFQDDGLGAETVGSMGGELIYPETFTWAFKDDMLYIEWTRSEEYISEYGKDIDVYYVEKGDKEFYITSYLDHEKANRQHLVVTDQLDIYSW